MVVDWDGYGFNQEEYDAKEWIRPLRPVRLDWFDRLMKVMYGDDSSMYTQ